MSELLRYGPPVIAWVVLVCWRGRDSSVRWLLLGLAVSLSALTPAGRAWITELTGSSALYRLIGHLGMLLTAWAAQEFLARMNGLPRSSRWHAWWMIGMCVVMCVLFALTPDLYPQSPWVFEYVVAYVLAQSPAFVNVIRFCLRFARKTPDVVVRLGLRMIVAGTSLALVYLGYKVLLGAGSRFEFEVRYRLWLGAVLPNAAHVLVLLGIALPAVDSWWRRYRQHARLEPLWKALYEANPAIALNPPGWWNLRLRLYRRVIEIRDGLLELQPYRDPSIAAAARESGADDATVEAAVIAAAIRARAEGVEPTGTDEPVAGGRDLASDTAFLCTVADAFQSQRPPSLKRLR